MKRIKKSTFSIEISEDSIYIYYLKIDGTIEYMGMLPLKLFKNILDDTQHADFYKGVTTFKFSFYRIKKIIDYVNKTKQRPGSPATTASFGGN